MPTITINKAVLEKIIGKKLPLEKLKDRISYLGTGLEKVEGNEITVEIFPNRPDLLSEQGLGRALASFIGARKGLKAYKAARSGCRVIVEKSVKSVRPYTACAIVRNLKLNDERIKEIIQIQEKLHITYGRNRKKVAIGIYPLEAIAMPVTYTAKKPAEIRFRPLEAEREMTALQILSQHPAGKAYGHLLEGKDRFPVFIDAKRNILSMPPIINSHDTGRITADTKEVFIECSGFSVAVLQKCLNIIVACLADMGGTIHTVDVVDAGKKTETPDLAPVEMKVDLAYVNSRLGLSLAEKDIKNLLERMGYGYSNGTALVPCYRVDILHLVDIIEDIAIAYGYENFKEEIPRVATVGEEDACTAFKEKIADLLAGLGLYELKTFHITNKETQTTKMHAKDHCIELKNPSTYEFNVVRAWMVPCLLEVLAANKHNERPQKVFDIGRTFHLNAKEETGIGEQERLAVALCDDKIDFTRIRQVLDYVLREINVPYAIEETTHPSFIDGRAGAIKVGDKIIGILGEIHPNVLSNFALENPVAVLEIQLSEVFNGC